MGMFMMIFDDQGYPDHDCSCCCNLRFLPGQYGGVGGYPDIPRAVLGRRWGERLGLGLKA